MMQDTTGTAQLTIRPLAPDDLPLVVAIDAALEGRTRRAYVERRLAAAMREPGLHAQFAVCDEAGLAGYILARVLEGEFGRSHRGLRLEMVGMRADARRQGGGRRLFDALAQWAARHQVTELRTAARWRDAEMLQWLAAVGFELAPDVIVGIAVGRPIDEDGEVTLPQGEGPGNEVNFGSTEANDFERIARGNAEVRAMVPADLREIVRIDRSITGCDRGDYIAARLREAMDDSAIRVSLAARLDGAIVGYLMARADLGDFGRTEAVAVIDTIGIDPDYAHRGLGHALLAQLSANLSALQVERMETVVQTADLALLGFFQDAGFKPSQRLSFVRKV
jgi:N-acetylglutamate synthase-like GNAT family acetyltransferase